MKWKLEKKINCYKLYSIFNCIPVFGAVVCYLFPFPVSGNSVLAI